MTLKEEIQKIVTDSKMSYDEKAAKLAKLVTSKELESLLPKPQDDLPTLKEPLKPKTSGMRTLNLSIHDVYFNQIKNGTKKIEFRDYNEYYIKRCVYEEDGKKYLVPYDAIVLYVGRSKSMTVALTDITCNGAYFMFYLGEILYPKRS